MNSNIDSQQLIKESITKLLAYCKQNNWAEFDPYDSLNSRVFRCTPFFKRKNFFTEHGVPKYFHDRTYPINIHSMAQSIITLLNLNDLDDSSVGLAFSVFRWAMTNMLNCHGYYYYQKLPYYTIKIPYMRWS